MSSLCPNKKIQCFFVVVVVHSRKGKNKLPFAERKNSPYERLAVHMFLHNAQRLTYNPETPDGRDGASSNCCLGTSQRRRQERCSSSPTFVERNNIDVKNTTRSELSLVEERLMIIKRNRASSQSSVSPSASPAVRVDVPPCEAYPTFNLSKPSELEQKTLETLVTECMNTLFFPKH
ncbi:unnamed protein product [Phytomonas sp. Hart1]|nr:unnamed protein product [Phytomonas sp. Hart1]|eukprot:CCW70056.1 unnamed protein product [Phytomonas sp. isolate Hart1]